MIENLEFISVTSRGTSGSEWIQKMEKARKWPVDPDVSYHIYHMVATEGVTTEIVVFPRSFFGDNSHSGQIRLFAAEHHLEAVGIEAFCLMGEDFIHRMKEIGWRTVYAHQPLADDIIPGLFDLRFFAGDSANPRPEVSWLPDNETAVWCAPIGFAFVVSVEVKQSLLSCLEKMGDSIPHCTCCS